MRTNDNVFRICLFVQSFDISICEKLQMHVYSFNQNQILVFISYPTSHKIVNCNDLYLKNLLFTFVFLLAQLCHILQLSRVKF